jgi:hypothetical protein
MANTWCVGGDRADTTPNNTTYWGGKIANQEYTTEHFQQPKSSKTTKQPNTNSKVKKL